MVHKNLTSIAALAGTCVHDAIEKWFNSKKIGKTVSAEELFEDARNRFREGWRSSSTDAWQKRPNKTVHLEEHHYSKELSEERTKKVKEMMLRASNYFANSIDIEPVRLAQPDSWLSVESMDTWPFMGVKIYSVPDFAYQDGDFIHIWDWKTGRPREEDWFQLHTYALYACEKWSVDPEAIVLHAAYLNEERVESVPIEISKLSIAQDRMSESIRAMLEVHYDPDEDDVISENWPTSGHPEACAYCRFRGICSVAPTT